MEINPKDIEILLYLRRNYFFEQSAARSGYLLTGPSYWYVSGNIMEGDDRRQYKQDFVKFLVYAIASRDETIDHLETLYEVGSLQNKEKYEKIHSLLDLLGKKLGHFLKTVQVSHNSEKNNID